MLHTYVPSQVGPSKLDLILADTPPLTDESKEKVILITDINKLGKLLSGKIMTPKQFYEAYDSPLYTLQQHQHDLQIAWNTKQYEKAGGFGNPDF